MLYGTHCSAYSPVLMNVTRGLQAKEDSKATATEDLEAKTKQEESKK